jgi:hypothetical protein
MKRKGVRSSEQRAGEHAEAQERATRRRDPQTGGPSLAWRAPVPRRQAGRKGRQPDPGLP